MMIEKMMYCDKCRFLRYEQLPRGAWAAICTNPDKAGWLGRLRTVDYSAVAKPAPVVTPVWCGERK